jgi:hypothetical protein
MFRNELDNNGNLRKRENRMRKILLSMALVVLIGAPSAPAQQTGGGSSTAVKGSGSGPLPAPVGHRQPRAGDVPSDKYASDPNDPLSKENAALDRKIKSICRGC